MSRLSSIRQRVNELAQPAPTPTARPKPGGVEGTAFCPLLLEAEGRGHCRKVTCGTCIYLRGTMRPGSRWLCASCAEGETTSNYWTDGACEGCGTESPVLALVL